MSIYPSRLVSTLSPDQDRLRRNPRGSPNELNLVNAAQYIQLEDNVPVSRTPIRDKLIARSSMDFGDPPYYTKEYRSIRWPNRSIGPRSLTPYWIRDIRWDIARKRQGFWDKKTGFGKKTATFFKSSKDLRFCMRENIPIKMKTISYNHTDQWVYYKGRRVIQQCLEKGVLLRFTYSGVYDKVVSWILREYFGLNIRLVNKKLVWVNNSIATEVDICKIYDIENLRRINHLGAPAYSHLYVSNAPLHSEYVGLINSTPID